ncbi:hypothetical protein QAD02_017795 [Eretmocerus hayati]|uniref:Uncharacterized protein n=1 Tax=Eretmocerus hayati TaxID=131215 RepID=A0ACC2PG26_9HYME|nr:hypothetical protein QAD02_017795 [Eretmocerus hayati]
MNSLSQRLRDIFQARNNPERLPGNINHLEAIRRFWKLLLDCSVQSGPLESHRSPLIVSIVIFFRFFTEQLVIRDVDIQPAVRVGEDYVILDCDYDFENTSSKGLVVKWYLNNFDLVYQWIYGTAPQAIDPVAKYIDLDYKASDNSSSIYRAMKLKQPDIDLTGNYTCLISTFEDEVSAKRPMTVYSTGPEEEFKLWHTKTNFDGKDGIEVTCQAAGLYPKPTLEISIDGFPDIKSPRPIITETEDGHYSIVSYLPLEDSVLPDSAVINCVLGIPSVNYSVTKKLVHYPPGRRSTTATAITIGGTTKLLRKMEIQALDNSQADASSGGGGETSSHINLCVYMSSKRLEDCSPEVMKPTIPKEFLL